MTDPLSILGAAVGLTSLIMQVTDECVRVFKVYNEAIDMPETYRYLSVRMQIEQQRFLNFGLEAGLLYADSTLSAGLKLNQALLIAILAEIKGLLQGYVQMNGKYKDLDSQSRKSGYEDKKIEENLLTDLLDLVSTDKGTDQKARTKLPLWKRTRRLGQAGRNLRSIAREPRQLVWATIDKASFESTISRLEDLNSFLVQLLDESQARRLQESIEETYLEILQVRDDIGSLKSLVEALRHPAEGSELWENTSQTETFEMLPATAMQQTRDARLYLRKLAEIKIQYTKMSNGGSRSPSLADSFSPALELSKFIFYENINDVSGGDYRTRANFDGTDVWIEWKDTMTDSVPTDMESTKARIGLLADFLRYDKPKGFRSPSCLGFLISSGEALDEQVGLVFRIPMERGKAPRLQTLRELIENHPKPSLSARTELCAVIARYVHTLHSVNWLHKGMRAENIIFFPSTKQLDLSTPYISGFDLSRPGNIDSMTEKPANDPSRDIYRHPDAQSARSDGSFRRSYDIYSLGVVLIEIALWKCIEKIVGFGDLREARPSALQEVRPWLLNLPVARSLAIQSTDPPCLQHVASECGDVVRESIYCSLTMQDIEKAENDHEPEPSRIVRLQAVMDQLIVKKLEAVACALQVK